MTCALAAGCLITFLAFDLVMQDSVPLTGGLAAALAAAAGWMFGERWPVAGWRWGAWLSLPLWLVAAALSTFGATSWRSGAMWALPPLATLVAGAVGAALGARRHGSGRGHA
jgi:hypothetical protein